MRTSPIFAGLALSATASAGVPYWEGFGTPSGTPSSTPTPAPPTGACAAIHKVYVAKHAEDPEASVLVPPSLALKCLQSIKVDVATDIEFIDYLLPFMQFQSTLEYLARPPAEYLIPGVDLVEGLLGIKAKLLEGSYDSQYDFIQEFKAVTTRVKDGHFGIFLPLAGAFTFARGGGGLVSVSDDGCNVPKVYLAADAKKSLLEGYSKSDIMTVDGMPILEYVETLTSLGSGQDPDALYNEVFEGITKVGQGSEGTFQGTQFTSIGEETVFEFTNGSRVTFENFAIVSVDFTEIDSPEALHKQVELPTTVATTAVPTTTEPSTPTSTPGSVETTTSSDEASPTVPGYPYPVSKHSANWISSYFLNETEYQDVGVLVLNAFEAPSSFNLDSTADLTEFYITLTSFLSAFEEAGKKKLVIDLQGNGGGFVAAAVDLLHEILPDVELDDGYRLRATDALDWIGENVWEDRDSVLVASEKNENGKPYKSWKQIFGPQTFNGDDFTHLISNGLVEMAFGDGSGDSATFPSNNTLSPGYLKADNIVILTDASCHSSCPLFTGWMSRLGGVRTIAVGGRPLSAPMQAMGGTKGGVVLKLAQVQGDINLALNKTEGMVPYTLDLPSVDESPLVISDTAINTQNQYLPGFKNSLPLQFVYEAAHCKMFYTTEMVFDVTKIWEAVAEIAWNGGKCVPGSSVNDDNTIGDTTPEFTPAVWSTAKWPAVPGALLTVGGDHYKPGATHSKKERRSKRDGERVRFVEHGPLPTKRVVF
ncbi:hypothetical protein EDB80DRAFT_892328 [Ilyonectria destructans]|nr:hypothetical protein EDB80DRAFT_892328 [Ilyonectria destructans]